MGIQGTCKECGFSPTLDYVCLRCVEKERDAALLKVEGMGKAFQLITEISPDSEYYQWPDSPFASAVRIAQNALQGKYPEKTADQRQRHEWGYESCVGGYGGNFICSKCKDCYASPPWTRKKLPQFCETKT